MCALRRHPSALDNPKISVVIPVYNEKGTIEEILRRVAETRMLQSARDRLLRVGSIEITPSDSSMGRASWQTVARPAEVFQVIQAAITRARQSGAGSD